MKSLDVIRAALTEAQECLDRAFRNPSFIERIALAADILVETIARDGHVFSCGNGGSFCDAMHFAEELSGRYRKNRRALPGIAISDGAHLTCCANDFGFDQVYARFIEANGRKGDTILCISTSGTSANIINAAVAARKQGMKVISLTGKPDSSLGAIADCDISVLGGTFSDRVQELHIKVIHILVELVERKFCPENY